MCESVKARRSSVSAAMGAWRRSRCTKQRRARRPLKKERRRSTSSVGVAGAARPARVARRRPSKPRRYSKCSKRFHSSSHAAAEAAKDDPPARKASMDSRKAKRPLATTRCFARPGNQDRPRASRFKGAEHGRESTTLPAAIPLSRQLVPPPPAHGSAASWVGLALGPAVGAEGKAGKEAWSRRRKGAMAPTPALGRPEVPVVHLDWRRTLPRRLLGPPFGRPAAGGGAADAEPASEPAASELEAAAVRPGTRTFSSACTALERPPKADSKAALSCLASCCIPDATARISKCEVPAASSANKRRL
mmetsp:Transcript_19618/g.41775  ORF Transcript_19618/g.41775 Transcript_19618/m.41775 type:complete len:305 (-) Transcript_19618:422-1336(-)